MDRLGPGSQVLQQVLLRALEALSGRPAAHSLPPGRPYLGGRRCIGSSVGLDLDPLQLGRASLRQPEVEHPTLDPCRDAGDLEPAHVWGGRDQTPTTRKQVPA